MHACSVVSNASRPHELNPAGFLCPWDFSQQGYLLLLSHFSLVRLCATPQMAAHQAPPSLGFSRQEHWSGLPFPSPKRESESEVAQPCPTLRDPMDCSLPGSSVHGIVQERVLEWGVIAFSEGYLKWVAISSFHRSSWPRERACIICISCTDRWILTPSHLKIPNFLSQVILWLYCFFFFSSNHYLGATAEFLSY